MRRTACRLQPRDREGLLQSTWEKPRAAQEEQRPLRRYYAITAAGQKMLASGAARFPTLALAVGTAGRRLKPSQA